VAAALTLLGTVSTAGVELADQHQVQATQAHAAATDR